MYRNLLTNIPENLSRLVLELKMVKAQGIGLSGIFFDKTLRKNVYRSLLLGTSLCVPAFCEEKRGN